MVIREPSKLNDGMYWDTEKKTLYDVRDGHYSRRLEDGFSEVVDVAWVTSPLLNGPRVFSAPKGVDGARWDWSGKLERVDY